MDFLQSQNITPAAFERRCGFSNGYLKSLRECPSASKLDSIFEEFPNLSRVWLLAGEGPMLNDGTTIMAEGGNVANNVNGPNSQNSGKVIDVLAHQLDEKDKQIGKLLTIIENLSNH